MAGRVMPTIKITVAMRPAGARFIWIARDLPFVMAGLVPAIHACLAAKTWMPGTRPGMTNERTHDPSRQRYSTAIATDSVAWKPLSPAQVIVIVPLSVATVVKASYGLADTAEKNSARNTSTPL